MKLDSALADALAPDFAERYQVLIAATEEERRETFRVRHQVFCEQLGYEMDNVDGCESDEHDINSIHILIRDRSTGAGVACFRLVLPQPNTRVWLPFDLYGVPHVDRSLFDWNKVNHMRSMEVSRLALNAKLLNHETASVGISTPYLAAAMFYAVTAITLHMGIEHLFMVIEPRLARLISRFGMHLDQISPKFEYYGARATFTTNAPRLRNELTLLPAAWRKFYDEVDMQLYANDQAQQVA
jgi:N-acyl amino acid synthase of PEP-CTERM/exosortase system